MQNFKKSIVIFGAGPAGLTAGYELISNSQKVTILESDKYFVGGIARTAEYKGYKFDIGGHRFFTKSSIVRELWFKILPLENWLLDVPRLSRIYFNKKFFSYPLKVFDALFKLGLIKSINFILSYMYYKLFPIKNVKSFEDWVTNNFGKRLYLVFFKTYTEKVWGMPCNELSADWAAQRIKGLSLSKAIINSLFSFKLLTNKKQKIKTLIDKFDYPKFGPGMLWEKAAEQIKNHGGDIRMGSKVTKILIQDNSVVGCYVNDDLTLINGDCYISSLPIKDLINAFSPKPDNLVISAANNLKYRDFLTIVLIFEIEDIFPDNWIYIHEPNVKLGRIQNFKNWSKDMVPSAKHTALGLEYFCLENDDLWNLTDKELIDLGLREISEIGLVDSNLFLDGSVVRMPKAYPVYDDEYKSNVQVIKNWLDQNAKNLQLVGRNGMHMYNNQDHSMFAAYLAAKNILGEKWDPWKVNADAEYHEENLAENVGRLVPSRLKD
jgi:protoporphyrinogen oxidase